MLSVRRRWAPAGLLGAIPYLEHYRRTYARAGQPWSQALGRLPTHALVDAVEVATMLEGTARHRTLML